MTYSIVIADDHEIVREGLKQLLAAEQDFDVVAEAENGLEAISMVKSHMPSALVLDIAMPYSRGIEVLIEAKRWSPETKVIVYTGLTAQGLLARLAHADADAVLLKRDEVEGLVNALARVLEGERCLAPEVEALYGQSSLIARLTARELQIMNMIVHGQSNNEIAQTLKISPKTVDNHRTNLMRKLDVHSVAELVATALREGLLDPARQL